MNIHFWPPGLWHPRPAADAGQEDGRSWESGPDWTGATSPALRNEQRGDDEDSFWCQSDREEELELPLPLKSDDELQHLSPFLPPHHCMHNYDEKNADHHHSAGKKLWSSIPHQPHLRQHSLSCRHGRSWADSSHWRPPPGAADDCAPLSAVSVNVPQFSVPPADVVSRVRVTMATPSEAEASSLHPQQKRRTSSLPDECRKVFVTHSSDTSSEVVSLLEFLRKHGFHAPSDIFDSPVRSMDITGWEDSHLKDPSTLIIIAISPRYKADVEGFMMDNHGLHTKYIHSMMQQEFIQQGSLNFRFIPLLFPSATQSDVPAWLQDTQIYRWPWEKEDLLLRLLREERFIPPPVPMDLTLIIRSVTHTTGAMQ